MPGFSRLILLFIALLLLRPAWAADYTPDADLQSYVWEYPMKSFNYRGYVAGVETLFRAYENHSPNKIAPGEHGVVGIKIYTASGPGLRTPPNLVRAVITALEQRGFERSKLFLIDYNGERLRESEYLPRRDEAPAEFEGVPVYALDTGDYYNKDWFYDSNLPSRERIATTVSNSRFEYQSDPEERKSYLAYPLISQVDFWINLPMASDDNALGISNAIGNATLWNISNNMRFFASPANAPVAAAEIAAIPELRETWIFTIQTLERYQFMGGPRFNSLYTGQEPKLWLSANPVAIDYLMWRRIYNGRVRERFPVPERDPQLFEYAQAVGLGSYQLDTLKLKRLNKAD